MPRGAAGGRGDGAHAGKPNTLYSKLAPLEMWTCLMRVVSQVSLCAWRVQRRTYVSFHLTFLGA